MIAADHLNLTVEQAGCALLAPTSVTFAALDASASTKRRAFKMDAYTGAVFDHPYLGRAVIDVAGIKVADGGVPALRQHKPELFVGRCENVSLEDGRVTIEGFLFDGVEAADEVARISDQGGKWQASIKVDPVLASIEFVGAESTATVNGVELAGPLAVLRESTLTESSFVPRGADTATSALALSHAPAASPPANKPKEPAMDPIVAERLRAKSIREAFPNHREFADEQVDKGVSLAEAKSAFSDVALADLAEAKRSSEVALAEANARAEASEKKAADALKQNMKPAFGAALGAADVGGTSMGAADEKDPIRRWDVALAAETKRLKSELDPQDIEGLALRRGIALSEQANLRALAVANLCEREPVMHADMVRAFNERRIGSRERNNKA